MIRKQFAILAAGVLFMAAPKQDSSTHETQSDRQKAGYSGLVRKVITQGETIQRKEYFPSKGASPERVEDTSGDFGRGHSAADGDEEEFDEKGRLIADASSDREMDQGPFRCVYKYDENGRLSEEIQTNRDHSPAGRMVYLYGVNGKKAEEIYYGRTGSLAIRIQFDDHGNETHLEAFGPDGSITRNETFIRSYRRDGNSLEESYVLPKPKPGEGMQLVRIGDKEAMETPPEAARTVKNRYSYTDSGQLVKEEKDGWEKTYDSQGRVSTEVFGPMRTHYSYDERGREKEVVTDVEPGAFSPTAEYNRTVLEYDSHGNETERTIYNRQGDVWMHYVYSYEYDARGNWTKRVETEKVFNGRQGGTPSILEIVSAEYRTISYY